MASTKSTLYLLVLICAAWIVANASAAAAATSRVGVAPLDYQIPNVGSGLARLLASEIAFSGYLDVVSVDQVAQRLAAQGDRQLAYLDIGSEQLEAVQEIADYLLVGAVVSFTVSDRDQVSDLGQDLNDLSRLLGTGGEVAHVALNLRLLRTSDGVELGSWYVEGIESRNGLRTGAISTGWAASIDFGTSEFSETMIGHAAYKAIGDVLMRLFEQLPLRGKVLAVSGDAVVIDLDSNCGLRIGDELTIVRVTAISDSVGLAVWQDAERVGSVQVTDFQPERCLCLILDGAGLIAEGDEARPLVVRYTLPAVADEE